MSEQQAAPGDLSVTNVGMADAEAGPGHLVFANGLDVAAAQAAVSGLDSLWGDPDLTWAIGQHGSSGDVAWVLAVIAQGSVSSPEHLLLFRKGAFVGTATEEPRPYTRVVDLAGDVVTVEYRWILGEEPFAAPAGAGTVRYEVTAAGAVALDPPPWPPEDTETADLV
ncbi:LppP/LprE family lipoprotein [Mycolicibacterium lutetiense]